MDKVKVIWDYNFNEVIGSATIEEDGTVTFKITDPRIIDLVKNDVDRVIDVIALHHQPAIPKESAG